MASFAVDGKRQSMVATGVVEPVEQWVDGVDGKRRRTDVQAANDSGAPLWGVEVAYQEEQWGRRSTETAKVTVPVATIPEPGFMSPIVFSELAAEVRVDRRSGGLVTSWQAAGISSSVPAPAQDGKTADVKTPGGK